MRTEGNVRRFGLIFLGCWLTLAPAQGTGAQEKPAPNDAETLRLLPARAWRRDPAFPLFSGEGQGAWDARIRERGWIGRLDGSNFLWYTGYNPDDSPTRFLGLARSPDAITWVRAQAAPLTRELWTEDVCVVDHEGVLHLFAEGRGDIPHRMTSTDGLQWEPQGPLDIRTRSGEPIAPGPFGTPTVWVEGRTWFLFYERADQGVWLSTSTDLAVWTNVDDEPVLKMGPEPYDRAAVAVNQITRVGDAYLAVYHANDRRPWGDWTTCLAWSRDLVHWKKDPRNPIVRENSSSGQFVRDSSGQWLLFTTHPEVRRYIPDPNPPGTPIVPETAPSP